MEKFVFNQTLTDGQLYRAMIFIMLRSKMVWGVFLLISIPVLIILSFQDVRELWQILIFPSVIFGIFLIGPFLQIKLKKMKTVAEFDDLGVNYFNNGHIITRPWAEVTHYKEMRKYLLVTMNHNILMSCIVPKNGFDSPEHQQEFIDLLQRKRVDRR